MIAEHSKIKLKMSENNLEIVSHPEAERQEGREHTVVYESLTFTMGIVLRWARALFG